MAAIRLLLSLLIFNLLVFCTTKSHGQPAFEIRLEPDTIGGVMGVQSYAYGQSDNKWLILGGRKDGLHRRQPFAAFESAGANNNLLVIDPVSMQTWSASLLVLSNDLQEQLSATNMQFHQEESTLYIIGGYGFSNASGGFTTFGKLCAVDVQGAIAAIINGNPLTPYFRQYDYPEFAVTGGHLNKISSTYYLVGGQNFIGSYNPHGPDHGPGFFQEYTNQLRKFNITDDGNTVTISNYQAYTDTPAFHRRDFNVVPQILPGGIEGFTLFSGVFQVGADIPYLNAVNVDDDSYSANSYFAQYYNHYHCAVLPAYSSVTDEMNNVFFGGIAQYYDSLGILVQDNNVPFVKTIACVKRDNLGNMAEYKLPVEMPALLGAGSEFILNQQVAHYANGVLKLDSMQNDTTLAGYIFGGISSTAANIFWVNEGAESSASSLLFKVYIIKNSSSGSGQLNSQSNNGLQLQVFPNPTDGYMFVSFFLQNINTATLHVADLAGKVLFHETMNDLRSGNNTIRPVIDSMQAGKTYIVTVVSGGSHSAQKITVSE